MWAFSTPRSFPKTMAKKLERSIPTQIKGGEVLRKIDRKRFWRINFCYSQVWSIPDGAGRKFESVIESQSTEIDVKKDRWRYLNSISYDSEYKYQYNNIFPDCVNKDDLAKIRSLIQAGDNLFFRYSFRTDYELGSNFLITHYMILDSKADILYRAVTGGGTP